MGWSSARAWMVQPKLRFSVNCNYNGVNRGDVRAIIPALRRMRQEGRC